MATAVTPGNLNNRRLKRFEVIGPALIVAALLLAVVGGRLASRYDWNPTGFVLFGTHFVRYTHPPGGAIEDSTAGYDGQFFYLQARDPLLLHRSTLVAFRHLPGQRFRLQRVGYPLLAYLLVLGQRAALPWSMLIIDLLAVVAVTAGFSLFARSRGWSGWWALGVGLLTGLLTGTLRDLSDPLATAAMLGGVMLWLAQRRWPAAALLTLAVLAREPMGLAVAGIGLEGLWEWRRSPAGSPRRLAARRIVAARWPVVVLPALAYLGWKLYATVRLGSSINSPGSAYRPPFVGVFDEIRHSLADPHLFNTVWNLSYLALMLAGVVVAGRLVWRGQGSGLAVAVPLAAFLLGLSLLVVVFGDPWSYTRLSAPMFALLLLAALQVRDKPALGVCGCVALLGLLTPLVPWLGAG